MAVAVMTLSVAACSDDDDPGAAGTTDASATTEAPVRTPPPTTEPPSTTDPAAITPPPETAAPTTESTPSTSTPPSPTDAAVAAFNALKETARECVADLQACDPLAAYRPFIGGDQLPSAIAEIEEARAKGYVARNVESMTETIEDVRTFAGDPTRVDIQFCAEDGVVLVLPHASGESLITDRFVSNRLIAEMHLDPDGRWRVHRYVRLTELVVGQENSICD